jgi:hypothetical protein
VPHLIPSLPDEEKAQGLNTNGVGKHEKMRFNHNLLDYPLRWHDVRRTELLLHIPEGLEK